MKPIEIFALSLDRVRSIQVIYDAFQKSVTSIIDCSDLLRSGIVLIVSALDQYVHEATLCGMLEIWQGHRPPTDTFLRYHLPFSVAKDAFSNPASGAFEAAIRERHGYLSFQQPDKVADALRLVTATEVWPAIAAALHQDIKAVKSQLSLLVDRRNKIAHEADMDPTYPGQRWPVTSTDLTDAIMFVENLVLEIDKLLALRGALFSHSTN